MEDFFFLPTDYAISGAAGSIIDTCHIDFWSGVKWNYSHVPGSTVRSHSLSSLPRCLYSRQALAQCSKTWGLAAVPAYAMSQQRLCLVTPHHHPLPPWHLGPVHSFRLLWTSRGCGWPHSPSLSPLCFSGWVLWDHAALGRAPLQLS